MKYINNLLNNINEIIISFFSSGLDKKWRNAMPPEKVLYLQVLNSFSFIAVVFMVTIYIFYYFYRPYYISFLDKISSTLFLFIFLALMIYIRITKNDVLGRSVIVISLFILLYAGVLFLDEEGAVYIYFPDSVLCNLSEGCQDRTVLADLIFRNISGNIFSFQV